MASPRKSLPRIFFSGSADPGYFARRTRKFSGLSSKFPGSADSGLADPAPVIHTLMSDRFLERRFMLGGIVTTVDSANGFATIEKHKECEKQVAVADRIVITKTDIKNIEISKEGIDGLRAKLYRPV